MQDRDELLTTAQVADIFHVSVSAVGRWVRDGDVQAVRTPGGRGQIRIRRSEVEKLVAPPTPEPAEEAS